MYVCGSIPASWACVTARSSRAAVIWRPPPSTRVSLEDPVARPEPRVGREHGAVEWREEVRTHELDDKEACRAERDQRRAHRGDRPPEDEAGKHAEREREERVRGDDEPFDVEAARADPPLEGVVRRAPPHHDRAGSGARENGADSDQDRLREQPAPARDALRPREAVGADLELAGEQRRADEEPGEHRQHGERAQPR